MLNISSGRDRLAVGWIVHCGQQERAKSLLRVESHASDWTDREDILGAYARSATVITARGRKCFSRGPTLVPWGHTPELVAGGMSCASGSSLVVTEHPMLPLEHREMTLRAVDVLTGPPTPDTRTDEQRELLEQLAWISYNGWTNSPAKHSSQTVLPQLAETGLTWAAFVGTMLALVLLRVDLKDMLRVAPAAWKCEAAERLRALSTP